MFDMRYHIASLVAVFFALAIGILLGTVIVDKGVLVDQQKSIVKRIETSFDEIRTENQRLRTEVANEKRLSNQLIQLAIKDRLKGGNIVVLTTTDVSDDVIESIMDNIRKAGATSNNIRIVDSYRVTEQTISQVQQYFTVRLTADNAKQVMIKKLIDDLAQSAESTTTPNRNTVYKVPYIVQIKNMGIIKTDITNSTPPRPVTGVVIVGGANSEMNPFETDLAIIEQLKALRIRVVGVETSSCKKSYMKTYQATGIPTVDNIDQPAGMISMIFALAWTDGNFGTKSTAQRLLPLSAQQ